MLQRAVTRSARSLVRPQTARCFAVKAEASEETLRPIHFEQDSQDAASRAFRIVGVRDVEVQDWEYPTRVETDLKKKSRPLRNRFQHPNFISLWIDDLPKVHEYLKKENIPVSSEGIVKGPDGLDVLVVPPTENLEFFNLCDNPTMVELVQATEDVIKEFSEEEDKE
ncbi:hypothetical protein Poli38472_013152 [Pythium oligandrum]|uniref:Uncharacterized protein n=1 Tax=Pythium oligandrum TaxID=41045 RepID=A0A8K1FAN9_PYTOL|nr:hypothetical protein Poli38472_013152 [Pythium oligandrum]|eukprot:TMW55261.1 hypothetical protein Poli38472_013152 [Pythium oligandrum]